MKEGDYVRVVSGPHCGSTGFVDYLDGPGMRALVNRGRGRRGGLTWIPLDCLRGHISNESPSEGHTDG